MDPLQNQIDDLSGFAGPLNERSERLIRLDTAITAKLASITGLNRLVHQPPTTPVHQAAFDAKIAAKNAEIERRIEEERKYRGAFEECDESITAELENWYGAYSRITLEKLHEFTATSK